MTNQKNKLTLAVTGSIAAYKAADLTHALSKAGYDVTVVMSAAATGFITPLTLQVLSGHAVATDVMAEPDPERIAHIALAKATDTFLVAPATADVIARLATGRADDLVTAVALALPDAARKFIAPAMNTQMYANPLTARHLATLKDLCAYQEIEPREGLLACGDIGRGALADLDTILKAVGQPA